MLTGSGCVYTLDVPGEERGVTFTWRTEPTLRAESTSLVSCSLSSITLVVKKTHMHNAEKVGAKRVALQGLVLPAHEHSLFLVYISPHFPSLPSLPLSPGSTDPQAGVFGFNFRFLHLCDFKQAT